VQTRRASLWLWLVAGCLVASAAVGQSEQDRTRLYKSVVDGKTYSIVDPVSCVGPEDFPQAPGRVLTKLVNKCSFTVSVVACVPEAEPNGGFVSCSTSLDGIVHLQHRVLDPHPPRPGGYATATGTWGSDSPFRGINVVACRAGEGELRRGQAANQLGLGNPSSFWMLRKTRDGALTAKCLSEAPGSASGSLQEWPFLKENFGQSLNIRIAGAATPPNPSVTAPSNTPPSGTASSIERSIASRVEQRLGLQPESVQQSLMGLWEISAARRTLLVDAEVSHVFEGELIDARTRKELTVQQRAALRSAAPPSPSARGRADTAAVSATFEKRFAVKPRSTRPAPWGLWEIAAGSEVAYVDADVNFALLGTLTNTATKQDVSALTREALLRIDFRSLPLAQAIKRVNGNGTRVIAVFADPNCPFCRKLEQDLEAVQDLTVHLFLYPLLGGTSEAKSHAVWCSPNKAAAWKDTVLESGGSAPAQTPGCRAPVEEVLRLGKSLDVQGTPTIFLSDGRRIVGAVSADKLEVLLRSVR
jgi:thiol:disulfide interchange protein DsbC